VLRGCLQSLETENASLNLKLRTKDHPRYFTPDARASRGSDVNISQQGGRVTDLEERVTMSDVGSPVAGPCLYTRRGVIAAGCSSDENDGNCESSDTEKSLAGNKELVI